MATKADEIADALQDVSDALFISQAILIRTISFVRGIGEDITRAKQATAR